MWSADILPRVFISSTVYDLKDVRGAVTHYLKSSYDLQVYASENRDFPIKARLHSYDTCLARLRECNLVILLIDRRYNSDPTAPDGVSITQREFRAAVAEGVPVFTFVRRKTWDERKDFKDFKKTLGASERTLSSDAAAFKEFNNGYDRYAESYRIYRFIDEVTQDSSSNWITSSTQRPRCLRPWTSNCRSS